MKRKEKRIGPNFLYIIHCLFNLLCNFVTNWCILNLCNLSGKSNQAIVDTIVWLTYNNDPVCLWQENLKTEVISKPIFMEDVFSSSRSLTQKNVIKCMRVWCASTATFTKKRWVWSEDIKMQHSKQWIA